MGAGIALVATLLPLDGQHEVNLSHLILNKKVSNLKDEIDIICFSLVCKRCNLHYSLSSFQQPKQNTKSCNFTIQRYNYSSQTVQSLSTSILNQQQNNNQQQTMTAALNIDQALLKEYLVPPEVPIYKLDVKESFKNLTPKEKLYSHHYSQAAWWGSLICLGQTSVESQHIFDLFQRMYSLKNNDALKATVIPSIVTEQEYSDILQYAAQFYGNMGNYLSFGDTKFIPRTPKEKFAAVVASYNDAQLNQLWSQCGDLIYSLGQRERELGLEENGLSTYYSPDIKRSEIELVQKFMDSQKISPYNTRLFKKTVDGKLIYQLLTASAQVTKQPENFEFEGITIQITYGDWSQYMEKVVFHLEQATQYCANDNQLNMTRKYIDSFKHGSIDDHKDSQRWWIKDISPVVETNIGFIESYRDPFGVRGEFEGFVSIVNKEMSKKLGDMINEATKFIPLLPWPREFEKDVFKKPDFTSLEVLTFASSGVPAGINIPNYDDIRQSEGFKNVSLGNVIAARKEERVTFIRDEDQSLFNKLMTEAFEVQVAIHESFGHGAGKLFTKDKDGTLNFDPATKNPLTGQPIDTDKEVYHAGATYDSVFKSLGSAMEECRAECAGVYLCVNQEILALFGHKGQNALDIFFVNWLIMARAGICALEFYSPASKSWKQAHMQGRYAILQVLLRAGQGLVKLDITNDNVLISLDRTKIESVGIPAIGEFLKRIMVLKATANVVEANKLFDDYTAVPEDFLKLREIVLQQKKPRKVFVQAHTYIANGEVVLQEFNDNAVGVIESMVTRFPVGN
ncbi:dipeptidyl-peptidase III [Heterostelium album PN500]|uniref:Dipeptidyl peptidase 3 n=1 Tax=Heterostelium pallidum (strain ATCC 26659 / Pp 5 / PN500) TaxID=670386 RepID=D3BE79_HETP5|nr:dipeptidyl-peptidase III [Heterostelium album PN500]EFA80210.1 dipeptidyl-peptidase III [Heterostelium album PN500]|eukprot:XP_020432330.1 dipeptidyl-peptidase III [Heterostelium album PN500]